MPPSPEKAAGSDTARPLLVRLVAATVLTAPLAVLAMVPPLQFGGWEWVAFALARRRSCSGRGGRSTGQPRRTPVTSRRRWTRSSRSGTLAAWAWSTVVLLGGIDAHTYFEVGAVITTLILLGRYLEARARRRSGEAIRALLALGAKDARVLRDGEEVIVPVDELRVGDLFVVRPGEKIATDGVVVEGVLSGRPVDAHRRAGARRGRRG